MEQKNLNLQTILDDSVKVILSPQNYFSNLKREGDYKEAVIRAGVYGVIAGIIGFLWSLLGVSNYNMGAMMGITAIIVAPIMTIIGVFIGGIILLIFLSIFGGEKDFAYIVKINSILSVMVIINVFFAILFRINFYLGSIGSLGVGLFSLYLLYNALLYAFNVREKVAKTTIIILIVIFIFQTISTMFLSRAAHYLYNYTEQLNEEYTENVEKAVDELESSDTSKEAEEYIKFLKKKMKEYEKQMEKE